MTQKTKKRATKKTGRSVYVVLSNANGILWEGRLSYPPLQQLVPLFLGMVFVALLLLLFDGLFGNIEETEEITNLSISAATTNIPPSHSDGAERLAYNLKNIHKKIDKLQRLQSKLHALRFLADIQSPVLELSFRPSPPPPANAAAGGGPDEASAWTPIRPLLQGMRVSQAALLDLQGFAINYDFWIRSWPHLWPLRRKRQYITSGYGFRKNPTRPFGPMQFHKGIDLRGSVGTPVQAVADGIVHIAKSKSYGYGKRIRIVHDTGFETLYAHLSHIYVTENQRVRAGSLIGLVGNTGNSTGPHLHYEIRLKGHAQNPIIFLDQ